MSNDMAAKSGAREDFYIQRWISFSVGAAILDVGVLSSRWVALTRGAGVQWLECEALANHLSLGLR